MNDKLQKTYYIFLYNCDSGKRCGSYYHARTTLVKSSIMAIRCIHCWTLLGWMEYKYLGKVKAINRELAIQKYKEVKNKNE